MKYIQKKPTQLNRGGGKLNTQNIVGNIIKIRSKQLVHRHSVIEHVEVKNTVDETVKKILFDYYKNKINVCMTSWVKRIHLVPNVIKNMLKQTIKPKMIWLTLSSDEFVDKTIIPQELFDLEKENENFTIHWVKENTKTMKKVFPVLPFIDDEDLIFLMDDDFLPHNDIIESRLIDFCNYGGNYCVSSYNYDGKDNYLYGGNLIISATTSLFYKKSLVGYEIFINETILKCNHDDEVYTLLLALNGYEFAYSSNNHVWLLTFISEETRTNYSSFDTRKLLNERVKELLNYEVDFLISKNYVVNWDGFIVKTKEEKWGVVKTNSNDLNIFICSHKNFKVPNVDNKIYKIVTSKNTTYDNTNLKIFYEDNVDEVTKMQKAYGEFSRMYYIRHKVKLPKYVGICHYRRYFDFSSINNIDINDIFKDYDAIIHKGDEWQTSHTTIDGFNSCCNPKDLQDCLKIAKNKFNISDETIEKFSHLKLICNNMIILPKKDYIEYVDFIYEIMKEFNKMHNLETQKNVFDYCKNNLNYSLCKDVNYLERLHGFIIERLTMLWLLHKNKKCLKLNLIFLDKN